MLASIGPIDKSGGIVLSGHTDVVPVTGQAWDTDPFTIHEKDGRLFGRGTCDMKGFVAVCMAFAKQFSEADLKVPIYFAFSYDEEIGCKGVLSMIDYVRSLEVKPSYCFVGEPTSMQVVRKHKGKSYISTSVTGFECHSSLIHLGVNAVEYAAELLTKITEMKRKKQREGPFDDAFVPPYTTIHSGVINGGTANNIIPKDCVFLSEWRFIPQDKPEEILGEVVSYAKELEKEMQKVVPETGINIKTLAAGPALSTEEDSDVVKLAQQFSGAEGTLNVSYMTEAGHFSQAGVPTVVIGPGSIEQAHKPNEYVDVDQMKQCENFMEKVLAHCSN